MATTTSTMAMDAMIEALKETSAPAYQATSKVDASETNYALPALKSMVLLWISRLERRLIVPRAMAHQQSSCVAFNPFFDRITVDVRCNRRRLRLLLRFK